MSKYPALIAALVQTLLAFFISAGNLTTTQAGVIEAAVAAAAGLVIAPLVKEPVVPAVTGFVSAIVTCLVAFQVPGVNTGLISLINAVVLAVAAFFVHNASTNKALAIERAKTGAPAHPYRA